VAVLNAPRIVTARESFDDSYTLARYLETGGYQGLRKAFTMFPEAVAAEVDAASLLDGRGGLSRRTQVVDVAQGSRVVPRRERR